MAWTEADKTALKAAIATGASSVTYSDGSSVDYRSLADMRRTLALIEEELSPTVTRVRTTRIAAGRGL